MFAGIGGNGRPKPLGRGAVLAIWAFLLAGFALDCAIAYRINLFIFYLAPVLAVTYGRNIRHGLVMSCAAALLWLAADNVAGYAYAHPLIPYWNGLTRFSLFVAGAYLLHFWKLSHELAHLDHLTSLANRRAFVDRLEAEIKRSARYKRPFSIAFIDLDGLKAVNDRFGHKMGDRMIVRLAGAIRDTLRDTDMAARMGGDEFAVLLPETEEAGGERMIERVRDRLERAPGAPPGIFLTMSAGLSTFADGAVSVDAALESADELMYRAKKAGKNRVEKKIHGKPDAP